MPDKNMCFYIAIKITLLKKEYLHFITMKTCNGTPCHYFLRNGILLVRQNMHDMHTCLHS